MNRCFPMLKLLFIVQMVIGIASAQEIAGPIERYPGGPWMVRVYFPDPDVVQKIAQWHQPRMVDFETGTLLLDVDSEGAERLISLGCYLELDEARTESIWQGMRGWEKVGSGIPGFPCYATVDETFALGASWQANFPDLADWVDIGDSWEKTQDSNSGDDLWVAVLTNKNTGGDKPKLFIMAAVHAREYTPAALVTEFGQYLLDNYDLDPDATWLLDENEIHLLLQANPDGRRRAETGLSWRKNTNNDFCSGTNSRGIDLNRNFPFQWGCCGGSSGSPCSATFRGPSPASEPEVLAIRDYVRTIFPDQRGPGINDPAPDDAMGIFMDIHSFSELVIWPYGFDNTQAPNGVALTTLGRKFAFFNGYSPEKASVSFTTDGTTDDFAYGDLGLAAFTFELGTTFFQPCQDFENTILPDNLAALIYAAKAARAPYLRPAGPDVTQMAFSTNGILQGGSVTLAATLDDTRYNQTNGIEGIQAIAGGQVFVDDLPWDGGTPLAMMPIDGSFDANVEEATFSLDTSSLTPGRHTVFVRGQDSDGNLGVFSAGFLHVFDPKTVVTISGAVRNHPTNLPLGGKVEVGPISVDSNASDGSYNLFIGPGTYDLVGSAPRHLTQSLFDIPLMESESLALDFNLDAYCAPFSDTVEFGTNGWTAEGDWGISDELANSGDFAWSDSPGGFYGSNLNVSLTSPVIDLTDYTDIRVTFTHQFDLPDSDDRGFLEYSTNGSTWTTLAVYNGAQPDWMPVTIDVPALNTSATAQIRFRLQTDFSISGDGWHVDDVAIEGFGVACYPLTFLDLMGLWPEEASVLNFIPLFPDLE